MMTVPELIANINNLQNSITQLKAFAYAYSLMLRDLPSEELTPEAQWVVSSYRELTNAHEPSLVFRLLDYVVVETQSLTAMCTNKEGCISILPVCNLIKHTSVDWQLREANVLLETPEQVEDAFANKLRAYKQLVNLLPSIVNDLTRRTQSIDACHAYTNKEQAITAAKHIQSILTLSCSITSALNAINEYLGASIF